MILLDAARGVAAAGAKAETLARARAAGLPVPDGFVVLPGEELDEKAILAALGRLGGERFAVRSSADVEDRPGVSAAGVFESVVGATASEVLAAVERVRASAKREAAKAYLGSRGIARARVAVLVQPLVAATALGVLHTAPVRDGAVAAEERAPAEPEWGEVTPRAIPVGDDLALGAARLAALVGGAADVEYARTASGLVFLQARPLGVEPGGRDGDWDPGDDAEWRRDVEHNPDPLSAAQASLVTHSDGLPGAAPQRVLNGFLFYRRAGGVAATPPGTAIAPADLPRRFADEIEPACDALLAPLEDRAPDAAKLAPALAVYKEVLGRYLGEITPSLARARGHLDQLLQMNLGEPLARHGALLGGTGAATVERDAALWRIGRAEPAGRTALLDDYDRRFGAWSPVWDVVVPTDDELPTRVLAMASLVGRGPSPEVRHAEAVAAAAAHAAVLLSRLDRMARGAFKHLLPVVRAALAVAEADDRLFFRAQRAVRRALYAVGLAAAAAGRLDDPRLIFELPIDAVRAGDIDAARARDSRALREQRRKLSPPSEIRARHPTWRAGGGGGVLRGAGTTGRGWGRAFVLRDPSSPPAAIPPGAVLVTATILPSLGYLLPGAAALVTDYGGALSHGATLAREYGVPAVLGTGAATRTLSDGEDLLVDGDAGRVYRIA